MHGFYVAALATGLTGVAGVIVAYLKRREAIGTVWIGLAPSAVGLMLCFVPVGNLVLALVGLRWLVRVIMTLLDRPIANPTGLMSCSSGKHDDFASKSACAGDVVRI